MTAYSLKKIKIIPSSSKNEIVEQNGDFLKIKIKAPAEKGKANRELIKFLAKEFKIKKNQIEIVKGEKSKQKIIRIKQF